MSSLASFAKLFSVETSSGAVLLAERCLRRRLNTNQCTRCLDICPSGALSLHGREITLNENECSSCMACIPACPQDALVSNYDFDELLTTFEQGRDLIVSCVHQRQHDPNEVVVPCIGIFSRQLLASIIVKDSGSVRFNVAGCSGCNNEKAFSIFLKDFKLVAKTLSNILNVGLVLDYQSGHSQGAVEGRRSYLLNIKENIIGITKKHLSSEGKVQKNKNNKSRRVPYKTRLVKNLLSDLDGELRERILSLFGFTLSVNDECTCCPLCKGICPIGAIWFERSEQGKKICFEMLDCSGCGLCVEFCKRGALKLEKYSLKIS